MSKWERVRLGEVIALDIKAAPVTATASYDIVGVLNRGRGLLYRDPLSGSETSYKTLNLIRPDQIVYSRLKAFEGAITIAPSDLSQVYASQEFPTFTCGQWLLPSYFRLLTTTKGLWDDLQNLSTGMGGRRERVKPADFLTIRISLPSVAEQNRIVDLMRGVDELVTAMTEEVERARVSLSCAAVELVSLPTNGGGIPLNALLLRNIGGAWGSGPGVSEMDVDVYRSTEFTNWCRLSGKPEARRSVPASQFRSRQLAAGDILVEKSGGTPTRSVGRVVQVSPEDLYRPTIGANFLQLLRADPSKVSPRYLFWILWASHRRGDGFDFQRASTNIRNLQTKAYLARGVDLPQRDTQEEIASTLNGLLDCVHSIEDEAANLRAFRSALLTSLLDQEIEIPKSYDDLLEGVS
ncbi:restriction endonuclease subunit S [Nocardiopsis sp. Huas11]|uniref:restriction endonuclease subunit S n=1 Tax=Nocardiopsis sp. Huas11 TaxID=2183912 RepID=UPI000EB19082|nr:restriction endonuclease subunit S [Nocardiopsis sp. Huas11]